MIKEIGTTIKERDDRVRPFSRRVLILLNAIAPKFRYSEMLKVTFLVAFLACAISGIAADKNIVCYFGSWAVYRPGLGRFEVSNINPTLCTHLIYTFVGITPNGNVKILDSWMDLPSGKNGFGLFTDLSARTPGTKALIAIGGWNEGSTKYSDVVKNPEIRARFVQNAVKFLQKYNFDGFDIDWEYPNQRGGRPEDVQNYVALLKELRQEFDKYGYILSVAVGASEASASKSYLISEMSQYVHLINLMTYDFNGSWESFTGINAPMYASSNETGAQAKLNVDSSVKYWLSQGAPADKINLGIPSYGRTFTLQNADDNSVGAPTIGGGNAGPYTRQAGTLGYNEICEDLGQGGWTVKREPQQHVPYAVKGNQWIGYDDAQSVEEKANYIKSMGLGGAMMWSIETDDFRGTCGEAYPLLNVLNRVLRGQTTATSTSAQPPKPTAAPPTAPPTSPPPSTNNMCTETGYMGDPKDCSIFYYCQLVHGKFISYTFHCPGDLAYDPTIHLCNYRSEVPGC